MGNTWLRVKGHMHFQEGTSISDVLGTIHWDKNPRPHYTFEILSVYFTLFCGIIYFSLRR